MRVLATWALSFSAAVFAAALLPGGIWRVWTGLALLCLSALVLLLRPMLRRRDELLPRRILLILCGMAVGMLYTHGYERVICRPITERCGDTGYFSGRVCSHVTPTDSGGKVTVWLKSGHGAKAVYYGDESVLTLKPGQEISGTAYWQDAGVIRDRPIKTFTSRGVYVLLYGREAVEITADHSRSMLWWPLRASQAVRQKIQAVWSDPQTRGFMMAELLGDTSQMEKRDSTMLSEAGLSHLFAVSGLHCVFLISLLKLLIPRSRRFLYPALSGGILIFYMLLVGTTPSVVRACIMQMFILAATAFRRDKDTLTSLSAALLVLLMVNPFAAGSVGLQLSFASTLGIHCISGRCYQAMTAWYTGKSKFIRRVLSFLAANISSSLGAMAFTIPLTAYYFDMFTLVSPLSNLLAVSVAGWNFMAGFVTVLVSFLFLPLARVIGYVSYGCVHYILWVCRGLTRLPWHVLYMTNDLMKYWLVYCYVMFIGCIGTSERKRKYLLASLLAALALVLVIGLSAWEYRTGDMSAVAVDVGQGESVLLHSGGKTALVDCGSSNRYVNAAKQVRAQMSAMNVRKLSSLIVTHYHADHTNGLPELLEDVKVQTMYLPDIEDEYGVKEQLLAIAQEKNIAVVLVHELTEVELGRAALTIYPPIGKGDLNEEGLSALCCAGEFELLITGDMAGSTEKLLVQTYPIPQVEVLLVSHHGSKYSSDREFLRCIQPQTAIISVGDNSYGHPSDNVMARLVSDGADVYRTDEGGSIVIHVNGAK